MSSPSPSATRGATPISTSLPAGAFVVGVTESSHPHPANPNPIPNPNPNPNTSPDDYPRPSPDPNLSPNPNPRRESLKVRSWLAFREPCKEHAA